MSPTPIPLPSGRIPHFNPKDPLTLWEYFVDYERLAEVAQLDEATKIKQSIRYLDREDAEFWEVLDEYTEANDWNAFKKTVLSFYPGSDPKDRWTRKDLTKLRKAQREKRIRTRGDFAEFDREFAKISNTLIANEVVSDLEARRLFWGSFDVSFQDKLEWKIELRNPTYTSQTIPTFEEIRHAANLVLKGTPVETSHTTTQDSSTELAEVSQLVVPAKTEAFDMERFMERMSIIVETAITTALDRVIQGEQMRSLGGAPFGLPRMKGTGPACFMCGQDDHLLNSCRLLLQYVNEGKLQRDVQGSYCLANGQRIPMHPRNVPWVQKIDDFYERFPNVAAAASTNPEPPTVCVYSPYVIEGEGERSPGRRC